MAPRVGERSISKFCLQSRKIYLGDGQQRAGRVCPCTLVDQKRKRYLNAVDVVERLLDSTDQAPNVRHLRVLHTFSSMTSLEL